MGLLDILKRKPKEQKDEEIDKYNERIDMYNAQVDKENTQVESEATPKLDLSKKIGLNFSKLNLDKDEIRKKRYFLLDVSGSMDGYINNTRKIDSLREVMGKYPDAHKTCFSSNVLNTDKIPEPDGTTNLAAALRFVKSVIPTPERIVLISDGEPNSISDARRAATELALPIDIIFIGHKGSEGGKFMEELAKLTNGQHFLV